MTFKQKCKILGLICIIISAVALFLPNIKDSKTNYNIFNLISVNGTKFGVIMILISVILVIISTLASISYDDNKFIPIVSIVFSLLAFILELFIKNLTKPSGITLWMDDAKIMYGTYILLVSSALAFMFNLVITFRTFILHKNDDEYYEDDEEEIEFDASNDTTSTIDNTAIETFETEFVNNKENNE